MGSKPNTRLSLRRLRSGAWLVPLLIGFFPATGACEEDADSLTLVPDRKGIILGGAGSVDPGWAWVNRVLDGQYRGYLSAELTLIRDHWLDGRDTLAGELRFHDRIGERRLSLNTPEGAFEFWSREYGAEQWWKEPVSQRVRRIANRSWKKPAFNTQMTFEDLLKIPGDFLLNYSGTETLLETDSTVFWRISLTPTYQSQYGTLEIKIDRRMGQPTEIAFYSLFGKPLKTMRFEYVPMGTAWQWSRILVEDAERLVFSEWKISVSPQAGPSLRADHTGHSDQEVIRRILGRAMLQPKFEAAPTDGN